MKINVPSDIKNLMKTLHVNGFECYVVGGAVRDSIIGVEPKDWDLFTNATGDDLLEVFPNGKVIGGEERQEKILTVIVGGVEISQYRSSGDRLITGSTLKEHLSTCDFNVNAIACDIDGVIIDEHDGLMGLESKCFGFVGNGEDRIEEDPLRLLRAVRLILKYGFKLNRSSELNMWTKASLINNIPKERISEELKKLLVYPNLIEVLEEYHLLIWVINLLTPLKGLDGGKHHAEKDVFTHSVKAYEYACSVSSNHLLNLAVLLHDVGKADTVKEVDGNNTFHNHESVGAEKVDLWMKEFKFSNDEIRYVKSIIKHHMMGSALELKSSTFARIIDDLILNGVNPVAMLVMKYSDNQANNTNERVSFIEFIEHCSFYDEYYKLKHGSKPFNVSDLEVNGHDLIKLGYEGVKIGKKLKELFVLVHDGDLINRRDKLMEYLKGDEK